MNEYNLLSQLSNIPDLHKRKEVTISPKIDEVAKQARDINNSLKHSLRGCILQDYNPNTTLINKALEIVLVDFNLLDYRNMSQDRLENKGSKSLVKIIFSKREELLNAN